MDRKTFLQLGFLVFLSWIFMFTGGYMLGSTNDYLSINGLSGDAVLMKEVYNHTIERVEVQACELSCVDARNEGYIDGVAECDMNALYYALKDGRVQSVADNVEAFNVEGDVIVVQTRGKSEAQILREFIEELDHQGLWYGSPIEHLETGCDAWRT